MIGKRILFIAIVWASVMVAIEGKRYLLRPIPAADVRRILKNAGREDAIPEGRVISQGLAAVKGFALGFKKGVIGVAIADGIAALSNTPAAAGASSDGAGAGAGAGAGSDSPGKPSGSYNETTNELCFTSRSATADIVASSEARQVSDVASGSDTGSMLATSPTSSSSGVTSPTTSNTNVNTNTGQGGDSVTQEGSTTTTKEDPPTVNCLVIKKRQ